MSSENINESNIVISVKLVKFFVFVSLFSKYSPKLNNTLSRFCLLTCYIVDQSLKKNMWARTKTIYHVNVII